MKLFPSCLPCLIQMAITACKIGSGSEQTTFEVLREVMDYLSKQEYDRPAPDYSQPILEIVSKHLNQRDPFREIKKKSNQVGREFVQRLIPYLEQVRDEKEKIAQAIQISIAGNIIDFATVPELESRLEEEIQRALKVEFALFELEEFFRELEGAEKILFLTDNAGELAFDRVLIELLAEKKKQVIVALKSGPALNDALLEDALQLGLDKIPGVKLITTGQARMGINLKTAGKDFLQAWQEADLIISKGQANFECLYGELAPIYFLTMIKCQPLSGWLGLKRNQAIFSRGERIYEQKTQAVQR